MSFEKNDFVRQIIAYQHQINRRRVEPDQNPRDLMLERVRKSGAAAKLLEVTIDLWYPLITAFNIGLNPLADSEDIMPITGSKRAPVPSLPDLVGANLKGANFAEFDLIGLNLSQANLQDANLTEADLSWANLSGANLSQANLTAAQLFETDLQSAILTGANLMRANLTGARYNCSTCWPAGFDPQSAGALLKD